MLLIVKKGYPLTRKDSYSEFHKRKNTFSIFGRFFDDHNYSYNDAGINEGLYCARQRIVGRMNRISMGTMNEINPEGKLESIVEASHSPCDKQRTVTTSLEMTRNCGPRNRQPSKTNTRIRKV